jgi:hypothetical protein
MLYTSAQISEFLNGPAAKYVADGTAAFKYIYDSDAATLISNCRKMLLAVDGLHCQLNSVGHSGTTVIPYFISSAEYFRIYCAQHSTAIFNGPDYVIPSHYCDDSIGKLYIGNSIFSDNWSVYNVMTHKSYYCIPVTLQNWIISGNFAPPEFRKGIKDANIKMKMWLFYLFVSLPPKIGYETFHEMYHTIIKFIGIIVNVRKSMFARFRLKLAFRPISGLHDAKKDDLNKIFGHKMMRTTETRAADEFDCELSRLPESPFEGIYNESTVEYFREALLAVQFDNKQTVSDDDSEYKIKIAPVVYGIARAIVDRYIPGRINNVIARDSGDQYLIYLRSKYSDDDYSAE